MNAYKSIFNRLKYSEENDPAVVILKNYLLSASKLGNGFYKSLRKSRGRFLLRLRLEVRGMLGEGKYRTRGFSRVMS